MSASKTPPTFIGPLAAYCAGLYTEKRALGYRYVAEGFQLRAIDRFCLAHQVAPHCLPKAVVQEWVIKRDYESPANHAARVWSIRHLAQYMQRIGAEAYVAPSPRFSREAKRFTPYIFSEDEISRLLAAADQLCPYRGCLQRDRILPAIFRLLYGCGLRVSEACALRRCDVDLDAGVLTIRGAKFDKDRLVPMAPALTDYLQRYAQRTLACVAPDQYYFPSPRQGHYSPSGIYTVFRTLLWTCGISHGGRGHGPRVHDLRHTFAVRCLQRWVQEGRDVSAALPVLSTYLGHNSLYGTQRYLRLTAEIYPEITAAVEAHFAHVIPERGDA